MVELAVGDKSRWLSMGEASRFLEVNEATLRQWADNGYLRVYRTPGGHRRFLREDVTALTSGAESPRAPVRGNSLGGNSLEGNALRRIRRRLHQDTVARQPWYQSIDEDGRVRMRLFGRQLLSLLMQENPAGRRRQRALDESVVMGREYGSEMAGRGVTLKDTIEAFIFFRTMVLDSADHGSWNRILDLADRMLLGVVESYQNRLN
ncbi:MAG: excisionase family DNA-binding protein [Chloroflexi bacterium]|nr:excisionase family DNA-binding protein [Chloroflexota bacterium]